MRGFCTAVQTALIGLKMHPTLVTRGMVLARSAREIKGVGGFDSARARPMATALLLQHVPACAGAASAL